MALTYIFINRVRTTASGTHPNWRSDTDTIITLNATESAPRDGSAFPLKDHAIVEPSLGFRRRFTVPLGVLATTYLVAYFERGLYLIKNDSADTILARYVKTLVDSTFASGVNTKFENEETANPSDPFATGGFTVDSPLVAAETTKHHFALGNNASYRLAVRQFTKIGLAAISGTGSLVSVQMLV